MSRIPNLNSHAGRRNPPLVQLPKWNGDERSTNTVIISWGEDSPRQSFSSVGNNDNNPPFPSRTTLNSATTTTITFHWMLIKQSNQVMAKSTIPSVDYSFSFSLTRCRDPSARPWHWPNYKYWATCSLVVTLSFLGSGIPRGLGLRGVISRSGLQHRWWLVSFNSCRN